MDRQGFANSPARRWRSTAIRASMMHSAFLNIPKLLPPPGKLEGWSHLTDSPKADRHGERKPIEWDPRVTGVPNESKTVAEKR